MAIKRILVALGGSEYMDVAMRDACDIARRHDGELYGLALGDDAISDQLQATPMGGGAAAKELRESREESIESGMRDAIARFNEVCAAEGIKGQVVEAHGEAIDVIVEQLKLMDLGIFGIRRAFDYGAGTHPDDFLAQVAKAARRPILAVATPAKPIKRVLVAYDGSLPAADALRSFAVLNAFDPEIIRVISCNDGGVDADNQVDEAIGYLESHGYTAEGRSLEGSPATAILEHATSFSADIIVMGVVGRSGFMKLVVGDTAAQVLAKSEIPLYLHY